MYSFHHSKAFIVALCAFFFAINAKSEVDKGSYAFEFDWGGGAGRSGQWGVYIWHAGSQKWTLNGVEYQYNVPYIALSAVDTYHSGYSGTQGSTHFVYHAASGQQWAYGEIYNQSVKPSGNIIQSLRQFDAGYRWQDPVDGYRVIDYYRPDPLQEYFPALTVMKKYRSGVWSTATTDQMPPPPGVNPARGYFQETSDGQWYWVDEAPSRYGIGVNSNGVIVATNNAGTPNSPSYEFKTNTQSWVTSVGTNGLPSALPDNLYLSKISSKLEEWSTTGLPVASGDPVDLDMSGSTSNIIFNSGSTSNDQAEFIAATTTNINSTISSVLPDLQDFFSFEFPQIGQSSTWTFSIDGTAIKDNLSFTYTIDLNDYSFIPALRAIQFFILSLWFVWTFGGILRKAIA
jgi:hypothetical protein